MLCKKCDKNYRMQNETLCPTCLVSELKDKLYREANAHCECLGKIDNLKAKVSRRNMQIKDLKSETIRLKVEREHSYRQIEDLKAKLEKPSDYNGWTNYETWDVKLWIDNDQASYDYWRDIAKEIYKGSKATEYASKIEQAGFSLRDVLSNEFDNNNPLEEASTYTDLLGSALQSVNWYEIAKSIIEEVVNV